MGQREADPRIAALREAGRNIYSFSKLGTFDTCPYAAYLTYYKGDRGKDNIYGILGGAIHDALQNVMDGKATKDSLLPALQNQLEDLEMLGMEFPHDFRGGNSIRDKWVANMTLFCEQFEPLVGTFKTEELLIYNIDKNRSIIGYADFIQFHDDGSVSVGDWKSSSWYAEADLVEHGRQLVTYACALEQAGYKVRSVFWYFLKYVRVTYKSKLKTGVKSYEKILDRCKVDSAIPKSAFDIKIEPAIRMWRFDQDVKDELLSYIDRVATMFEALCKESNEEGENHKPWPAIEITKKNSFFCNNLCSHGKNCPTLKDYNSKGSYLDSDDDLF